MGAAVRRAIVMGVGVNCARHPEGTPYPVTDFSAAGFSLEPAVLFDRLAARMLDRLAQWRRGDGFPETRKAWLMRAYNIGREIEVKMPESTIRGRFEEIDEDGALVLSLSDGHRELIRAGDVFPASSQ